MDTLFQGGPFHYLSYHLGLHQLEVGSYWGISTSLTWQLCNFSYSSLATDSCFFPQMMLFTFSKLGFSFQSSRVAAVPGQDLLLTQMLKHYDHELMLSLCHHKHIFLFSTTDQIESWPSNFCRPPSGKCPPFSKGRLIQRQRSAAALDEKTRHRGRLAIIYSLSIMCLREKELEKWLAWVAS